MLMKNLAIFIENKRKVILFGMKNLYEKDLECAE